MMEPTFITKLFTAYADISTIPWVGLPLGVFIWSFIKSSTYHQDNFSFHRDLRDVLDRQAFKKIIVPLFSFISENLTQEIANDTELQAITDKDELLKTADAKKKSLLVQRDFTYLESAIEFQDTIEKILKSKKNQMTLKNLIRRCRVALISLTIASAATLLLGIVWIYFQKVAENESLSFIFGVLWTVGFSLSLIFGAIWYYKRIKIEGLVNE